MPVKFSKHNRKLTEIVTNCEFDFRFIFALNDGHLGYHLHYFNLVDQTCECFILIVCIIRPLKLIKSQKMLYIEFLVSYVLGTYLTATLDAIFKNNLLNQNLL